jgi:hypothetical protein
VTDTVGAGAHPIHPLEMTGAKIALFKVMEASLDLTTVAHELSRFTIEGEDSHSFAFGKDVTIHLVNALIAILDIERPRLANSDLTDESDLFSIDTLADALGNFRKEWADGQR